MLTATLVGSTITVYPHLRDEGAQTEGVEVVCLVSHRQHLCDSVAYTVLLAQFSQWMWSLIDEMCVHKTRACLQDV